MTGGDRGYSYSLTGYVTLGGSLFKVVTEVSCFKVLLSTIFGTSCIDSWLTWDLLRGWGGGLVSKKNGLYAIVTGGWQVRLVCKNASLGLRLVLVLKFCAFYCSYILLPSSLYKLV